MSGDLLSSSSLEVLSSSSEVRGERGADLRPGISSSGIARDEGFGELEPLDEGAGSGFSKLRFDFDCAFFETVFGSSRVTSFVKKRDTTLTEKRAKDEEVKGEKG